MKKNIIIATLVAASALLASISCTKQDDVQSVSEAKVFTATIEQGLTKTTLKESLVFWDKEDSINIKGAIYSALPSKEKPTSATFTLVDGESPEAPYEAVYPASLWQKGTYCFPDVQYYQAGRFNAPMFAMSSNENLTFNSICGVICLRLTSQDESETIVRRIVLATKGELVSGPFKVDKDENGTDNWRAYMMKGGNGSSTVTLDCGEEGVTLDQSEPKEFYIYLPARTYESGMTVSIESTNPDCSAYEMHTSDEVSVECNSVYSFNWEVGFETQPPYTAYTLPYVFSVGPNNCDTVHFSRGNLQATYTGSSQFSWKFAENQYDFIGDNSGNSKQFEGTTLAEGDVIDLFCWSTDNNQYGTISAENSFEETFVNWGQAINNGSWFTLSGGKGGEWQYLLETRKVNGGSGIGYTYERLYDELVCGMKISGVIIFPDGFVDQNVWKTKYKTWNDLAYAGIVFLPKAGFQYWNWDSGIRSYENYNSDKGAYWSSSSSQNKECAQGLFFEPSFSVGEWAYNPKLSRASVRLVSRDFVPAPAPEVIEAEEWVESEQ